MDFLVKQINHTKSSIEEHYNAKTHVDVSHGIFFLTSLVLLPLVNSGRNANIQSDYWSQLPWFARLNVYLILTTILVPSVSTFAILFLLYKIAVILILRLRFGNKFKGLLNGPDTLWTLEDNSNGIVNILIVMRHENADLFQRQVIKKLQKINDDPTLWKLQCRHSSFMGFSYLLSQNPGKRMESNTLRQLDGAFFANHHVLQATLSELASTTIPGGQMWEVYIGAEEISWGGSVGTSRKCFPLIVRFHHALGDGLALLQLVQQCFGPSMMRATVPKGMDTASNELIQQMVRISIRLMHSALLFYKFPQMILRVLAKKPDVNCLHNRALSGEKVIAWKVENGYKYVNRVKVIKRRLKSAAFMDVISASVSYALDTFYKQKHYNVKHVNVVIPAIAHAANFTNMNASAECTLTNRFSVGVLKLPVDIITVNGVNSHPFYWRCARTIANLYDLRTSYEFQLNHWLLSIVMSISPRRLIAGLLQSSLALSTLVISNLPGPRRVYLDNTNIGENFVEDIVFWVPQRGLTGVSISIFTYDDRFQLGISIDKVFGVTTQEAEGILQSLFDYIDRLHDELIEDI